jgi:peptidoglycan hydrolase-like protein with peptidoglycan-binding domain
VATASRPNPLSGMPLDYLIGADGPQGGTAGRITETPFGVGPAAAGSSVGYCNLRREDGEPEEYGPYLSHDDIFAQYKEGRPDPQGQGFQRNIVEQLDRCRQLGHTLVEEDNPDSYELPAVMLGVDLAQQRGLGVVAKNPGLMKDGAPTYVAHPNVVGIIVEKDCGTPAEMDDLRRQAGKPDLPVWFVSFGRGRSAAVQTAKDITDAGFVNMGVTYSRKGEYQSSDDVLLPLAAAPAAQRADSPGSPSMPTAPSPSPLDTMKSIMGTKWSPSDGENPTIIDWLRFIGSSFPEMADYCTGEMHIGYFSWCGATVAYCMAKAGVRPVYTRGVDTKSFLWAAAWLGWGTPATVPQPGDVLVFDFGGGDRHVTLFDHDNGDGTWSCRGGNQSHEVKLSDYRKSQCMGVRRPAAPGQQVPASDQSVRPVLEQNAVGAAVSELQHLLGGIDVDGEFGPDTEAAVRTFQASHGLAVNGIVDASTWAALLAHQPSASSSAALTPDATDRIAQLAGASDLARYPWHGRGVAPPGYIKGMAVAYAAVYAKWKQQDSSALVMAAANSGNSDVDALAWYDAQFSALGMSNAAAGADTLRHLFVLLIGLGMRESSGCYCEGRDTTAGNVSADTAEAGLFQQSWNSRFASPELPKLFATYSANPQGFLSIFKEGVPSKSTDNFGSGDGAAFQALCKSCPEFAVEAAAVGLRTIRKHWGPINRQEAEIRPEADRLLQQVQGIVDSAGAVVAGPVLPGPTQPRQWPLPADSMLADILNRLKGLENIMTGTPTTPTTPAAPAPPHVDLARIEQDIARLGQIASTFSQFANTIGQIPTTGLPPQAAQIEQSISRLGQIAATLSQFATSLSGLAPAASAAATATAPPPPVLSPIDKLLGGQALVGLKTPLAIGAYALMWIMQAAGNVGTATGDKATTTGSVLTALITAFGGLGVTAKFDRAFQAIGTISSVLQKLPGFPALPTTPPKP